MRLGGVFVLTKESLVRCYWRPEPTTNTRYSFDSDEILLINNQHVTKRQKLSFSSQPFWGSKITAKTGQKSRCRTSAKVNRFCHPLILHASGLLTSLQSSFASSRIRTKGTALAAYRSRPDAPVLADRTHTSDPKQT